MGYADWESLDGLFLDGHPRHMIDRYRLQMYHYLVGELAHIQSMQGKTLLETGCGRGGGLKYLVDLYKPGQAMGVDSS